MTKNAGPFDKRMYNGKYFDQNRSHWNARMRPPPQLGSTILD